MAEAVDVSVKMNFEWIGKFIFMEIYFTSKGQICSLRVCVIASAPLVDALKDALKGVGRLSGPLIDVLKGIAAPLVMVDASKAEAAAAGAAAAKKEEAAASLAAGGDRDEGKNSGPVCRVGMSLQEATLQSNCCVSSVRSRARGRWPCQGRCAREIALSAPPMVV